MCLNTTLVIFSLFLFYVSSFLDCFGEQHVEDINQYSNLKDHQWPHFDSVILSGSPLNNLIQQKHQHDGVHSKGVKSFRQNGSLTEQLANDYKGRLMNMVKMNRNNYKKGTGEQNFSTNTTAPSEKVWNTTEQGLLQSLHKNPLIKNLLNTGTKLTHELNMTVYLIKDDKASGMVNRNVTNLQRNSTKVSGGMHGMTSNVSRNVVAQNITVFLDTPESAESFTKAQQSKQTNSSSLIENLQILKGQQTSQDNQKAWSWNQRTGGRWGYRTNRKVGGRYKWRRPRVGGGRLPAAGGNGGNIPTPVGQEGQSPGKGNKISNLRPSQGRGPSGGGNNKQGDSEFEQEALTAHNNFRAVHNAPAMTLNNDLSQQAKAYAQKIAQLGALQHSSNAERGQYVGENLAMGCSSFGNPLSGKKAVTNWYNEVCLYDFNNPGFSMNTGHFTQVVWQDSTELGIGKATGKMGQMACIYVVGRYKTAGNFNNMFGQQVLRGAFDQSYCNVNNREK